MINRQRLLWTIATRRQLERWEPFVALNVRSSYGGRKLDSAEIWEAEIEHHFALIAARNLLRALDLEPPSSVPLDPTLREDLIAGRDLIEHWDENAPAFNITPRRIEPARRSGKDFAARHPDQGPYFWLRWSSKAGALLLPHVPALKLHELLDAVEAEVLSSDDALARFVPPRSPSPWIHHDGRWWPRPEQ